jgi:hypothetical protein
MGRRRQYESASERQKAFRQRLEAEWPRVNGAALSRLHEQMAQLQAAVDAAARAGDAMACACRAGSVETVLERVIAQFEARAQKAPAGERR